LPIYLNSDLGRGYALKYSVRRVVIYKYEGVEEDVDFGTLCLEKGENAKGGLELNYSQEDVQKASRRIRATSVTTKDLCLCIETKAPQKLIDIITIREYQDSIKVRL
jgi:hypothetical protein